MRTIFLMAVLSCFVFPLHSAELCSLLKRGGSPAAYLMDPKENISAGPIELGDLPLAADIDDERFRIDTKHFIIAFSRKIYVKNNWLGMGYGVDLIPVKPSICAEATTYRVVLNWVRRKGEVRPYRFDAPFPRFALTDELGYEEDVSSPYKFKPVVTGRMVNP